MSSHMSPEKQIALFYGQLKDKTEELERVTRERNALQQQAEGWAMEAKSQRATVHESYQAISGATGEPGDWSGAEPVKALVAERDTLKSQVAVGKAWCQKTLGFGSDCRNNDPYIPGDGLCAHYGRCPWTGSGGEG